MQSRQPSADIYCAAAQATALSSSVAVIPYPIPPAGADLSNWQPDEEPPPLTFNITLGPNLLVPADVRVGWWDVKHSIWSHDGIRWAPRHAGILVLCHVRMLSECQKHVETPEP